MKLTTDDPDRRGRTPSAETEPPLALQTWRAAELTFESDKHYADSFADVALDLVLTCGERTLTVPGFWDGGDTFRVRFSLPAAGRWRWRTVCSDESNGSLHGRTGEVSCLPYTGPQAIYRRGFVTARYRKRYLTYDDGTPFFYLGDTHWSLGDETPEMVREICGKRAAQGFTVWQSEPIGAKFDLTTGVSQADIEGLRDFDEKFRLIAEAGLVHANAQFFFPSSMASAIEKNGGWSEKTLCGTVGGKPVEAKEPSDAAKAFLRRLSRYWVARYGAFPVLWTLGQEVDDDFYWNDSSSQPWNAVNNPYRWVAACVAQYDAYRHPLTAHQENAALVGAYGSGAGLTEKRRVYAATLPSAFRDVPAHTFYAAQWSPSLTAASDRRTERDFWHNGQGKPVINYEGRYCGLWTGEFGSRMQGWVSYLSGMFGYGWGAQDTWSYRNTYDEDKDTDDGVETITAARKTAATWRDALTSPCGEQMGAMRRFLEDADWYDLKPRFDNRAYFTPAPDVFACCAGSRDNAVIVLYFYSFSDPAVAERPNAKGQGGIATGTVGRLSPLERYVFRWFDPIAGAYIAEGTFTASPEGTWAIGPRPRDTDLALLIRKTTPDELSEKGETK